MLNLDSKVREITVELPAKASLSGIISKIISGKWPNSEFRQGITYISFE